MKPLEEKAANCFLLHHDFVKQQVLRYAPLPGLVDDICQQVFLEFVSKSDRWDLDGDVRPVLVVLIKGFSMRALQEKRKHVPGALPRIVELLVRRNEFLGDEGNYEKEKGVLRACIERLNHRNREIVRLYYYNEYALQEIGELMFISPNAVSHVLCRIRNFLRKCIRKSLGNGEHRS